jgi:integrase
LAIRVNRTSKTWVYVGRLGRHASRHKLGSFPEMTLAQARQEALRWRLMLAQGKSPVVERERARRQRQVSFSGICDDFFADNRRRGLRRAHETEREIRRELVSRWGKRAVTDIDRADVLAVIDACLARGAPYQAHHLFGYCSRVFNWAIERGLRQTSPCAHMWPSSLIGAKEPRTRVLTDDELRALWVVADPFVKMLILTGQRRGEVAGMRWSEISTASNGAVVWTIPRERMKMKSAHVVPLVGEVIALLERLPRINEWVFGRPIRGFDHIRKRLPGGDWTLQDVRRTVRTHLSALPVSDMVRELVIGHTKRGLHRVYDQYAYLDEKRQALTLWTERLLGIVQARQRGELSVNER